MKPLFLTAVAASALIAGPALSQQSDPTFEPGAAFLTNWDMNEDGKITIDELRERRADIFAGFDEDEDGTLSAEEFEALDDARLGSMQRPADGGNRANGRAEQALSRDVVDGNGDGAVSLEEYLAAATGWMTVMDGNGDGVIAMDDFGPGSRQPLGGMGQGPGQGRGQGLGQGPGQGQGQGMGQGPGRNGGGQGMGQGGQGMFAQQQDPTFQPGQGQDRMRGDQGSFRQGRGQGYDGQRGGWNDQAWGKANRGPQQGMKGHGGGQDMQGYQGGPGMGRGQQGAQFQAFPTDDGGMWIVDGRTGDILLCRSATDSSAPAGFTVICAEADL